MPSPTTATQLSIVLKSLQVSMAQKPTSTPVIPVNQRSREGSLLVSVADLPDELFPTICIPENRYGPLTSHGTKRARHSPGSVDDHIRGILGEFAVASLFNVPERVDTRLYESGDQGFDLVINGSRIDVKTAGPRVNNPRLMVDADEELRADLYVLVQELSSRVYRILGYAPLGVVAQASVSEFSGRFGVNRVRAVEQDQLSPLLMSMVQNLGSSFA